MRNRWLSTVLLGALVAFAPTVTAQKCPAPDNAQYPGSPLSYPMTSDQYAVQYSLDGGTWTDARVYISIYGGTNSSPYEPYSTYLPFANYPSGPNTSMSFVSIPAHANASVQIRVTNRGNGPFLAGDQVSVRPAAKRIRATLMGGGKVQISTTTAWDFAGEQFILWWDRDATHAGAVQGLAFFLDPPYDPPNGNVAVITSATDFSTLDLHSYDAVEFEGTVAIGGTPAAGTGPEGPGAQELVIPPNINTVFLAPRSWVQGKLRFDQGNSASAGGQVKYIYGPGVLDGSRFNYVFRQCRSASGDVVSGPYTGSQIDGFEAVSWFGNPMEPDIFVLDGIVVSDIDYTATANILNGVVNNVKVIGWNGNNDGFQMAQGTIASNVFVRTSDDSLEMWGGSITVTNATVWQNYSGGIVNLGWLNKFPGDYDLVDCLYVVRTDWPNPTRTSWIADPTDLLAHQDNGIIVSLMVPDTKFGAVSPPVYRNIFVDDTPRVFLSLKILPPDCDLSGLKGGPAGCPQIDLTLPSVVNLKIENVFTPQSIVDNSIGFQTLPSKFSYVDSNGNTVILRKPFTLKGTMNIDVTNVFIKLPDGIWVPLWGFDAGSVGRVITNGDNVDVDYSF